MPSISGTVGTYNTQGHPRDLMDIIFDVSPSDTPFLSMCKRAKATQTKHEWDTHALADPADNAQVEGQDTTSFTGSSVTDVYNVCQIMEKGVKVTKTAQAVESAGIDDMYDFQVAQRMKEIKKDVEFALLSNRIQVTDADGSTARRMRGLPAWLTSNVDKPADGAVATGAAAATAGTKRNLTEALVTAVLQSVYTAGGNPDYLMADPPLRQKLSEILTGGATKMDKTEDKKIVASVDVYVSDWGEVKIIPNRVQAFVPFATDTIFALDSEYWGVAFLRNFQEQELSRTGSNKKGLIDVECTLEARNEKSSGMITDVQ